MHSRIRKYTTVPVLPDSLLNAFQAFPSDSMRSFGNGFPIIVEYFTVSLYVLFTKKSRIISAIFQFVFFPLCKSPAAGAAGLCLF